MPDDVAQAWKAALSAGQPVTAKLAFEVGVEVTVYDPDVIERITGPGGDEWRSQLYDLYTADDALAHLAYNCVANGCENATMLDGWADLPREAVRMRVGAVERCDHDIALPEVADA